MVIFEVKTKEAQQAFAEIKKVMTAAKNWKVTARMEITVMDGQIQLVGQGFVKTLAALTTGSCKLVVSSRHWFDLITMTTEKVLKVVVTEGEAMVGRVTVNVLTTFFETDRILRSISLPANPKTLDFLMLEYQGYTKEELRFNCVLDKIENAKKEFEQCIRLATMNLMPLRISSTELREMVLDKLREKEKANIRI